jgi:hypothetical protein
VKISRAEQKAINERLREEIHQRDAAERRYRAQQREEEQRRAKRPACAASSTRRRSSSRGRSFQKSRVA